ncbi:hypothetical protein niasHS_013421 [Heterodera schachtii]|uniref:Uncharacterized protein n=1 Tax=Heterodera schachtii TaxID=97005 RepID=A0ABD2IPG5_HETSC
MFAVGSRIQMHAKRRQSVAVGIGGMPKKPLHRQVLLVKRGLQLSNSVPLDDPESAVLLRNSSNNTMVMMNNHHHHHHQQQQQHQGGQNGSLDFPSIVLHLTARDSLSTSVATPPPLLGMGSPFRGRRRAVDISAHKACALLMARMKQQRADGGLTASQRAAPPTTM